MALNDVIVPVERFTAISELDAGDNSVMTLRMAEYIEAITMQVNQNIPLTGSGSPEGVEIAEPFRIYIDTTADDIYYKKTGDGDTGWQIT